MEIPRLFYGRMCEVSARATKLQNDFLRRKYGFPAPLKASPFSMKPTAVVAALGKEGLPMTPNPVETPGRVYELFCTAVRKFKSEAPWPPS